jgi:hypothetical protein
MGDPFNSIREVWQGSDLPNNAEILEAVERYRELCLTKHADDVSDFTIGTEMGYLEGLAFIIATTSRDCWAPLFRRPIDPQDYKRQRHA